MAGHVYQEKTSPTNMTVLWQTKHGTVTKGRSATTIVDTLLKDTKENSKADLHSLINNRDVWGFISGSWSIQINGKRTIIVWTIIGLWQLICLFRYDDRIAYAALNFLESSNLKFADRLVFCCRMFNLLCISTYIPPFYLQYCLSIAWIRWLLTPSSLFIFSLLEGRGSLILLRLSALKTSLQRTHILLHVKTHQI